MALIRSVPLRPRSRPSAPALLASLTRLALGALLALQACVAPPGARAPEESAGPSPPPSAPLSAPIGQAQVELRLVLHEDDWRHASAPVYPFEGRRLVLGPPHLYGLEQVDVVDGHMGTRALEISVVPAHADPLARWTGDHVGRKIALLAGDRVVVLAKIGEPFPNPFQLNARYNEEQAAALALQLSSEPD